MYNILYYNIIYINITGLTSDDNDAIPSNIPNTIGVCDGIKLDATKSYVKGIRNDSITWYIDPVLNNGLR